MDDTGSSPNRATTLYHTAILKIKNLLTHSIRGITYEPENYRAREAQKES